MKDNVKSLIAKIEGDDNKACQNAITDLMFLMEDSTKLIVKNRDVGDEYMSQEEQVEVIHVLIALAESFKPEYSGLLWVVGKANPPIMIEPVQDFILTYVNTMPHEMLYQAIVALENCMVTTDSKNYHVIKPKFKHEQILAELKGINTQDSRLRSLLDDAISIVEYFIAQPD